MGFKEGGWVFSLFDVIAVSIFIVYCNIALADCTEICNTYSFTKIGEAAFGKCGKYFVEYGIAISQILFPCGYANLIASQIDIILQAWFGWPKETHIYWYVAIALVMIFIPMCFIKDVTVFSKLHLLGDIAVAATVITLGATCASKLASDDIDQSTTISTITPNWAKTLGMTITMLEGVGLVLPIKVSYFLNIRNQWRIKMTFQKL
jgi:amino acid permease